MLTSEVPQTLSDLSVISYVRKDKRKEVKLCLDHSKHQDRYNRLDTSSDILNNTRQYITIQNNIIYVYIR